MTRLYFPPRHRSLVEMSSDSVRITLSPLDHIPPQNYVKIALYLPLKDGARPEEAFSRLQEGLQKTFIQLPWLSGKVHWQPENTPGWRPGQLEIRHGEVDTHSPKPYQLKQNNLDDRISYDDLKDNGFSTDEFEDHELLWAPFLADINAGAEVFVAQANFMPGGCLLAMSTCHPSADGTAMITILKLWASHCRSLGPTSQVGQDDGLVLPQGSSDREILERLWDVAGRGRAVSEMDPDTWQLVGLDHPTRSLADAGENDNAAAQTIPAAEDTEPPRVMKSSIFYISAAKFAELKKQSADEAGTKELSGNDVATALIWRSLLKARTRAKQGASTQDTGLAELEMTVDGRPDFSEHLPSTYLGNVVFVNRPSLPLATLVSPETTIGEVAKVIRKSAGTIHHEAMMDAYKLLRDVPDYGMRKLRFTSVHGTSMLITSLLMFPIEEICFGEAFFGNEGRPEAFRPLMSAFNRLFRISFILPRERHGGVEFVVSLFENEMDLLLEDEEFSKYALQVS